MHVASPASVPTPRLTGLIYFSLRDVCGVALPAALDACPDAPQVFLKMVAVSADGREAEDVSTVPVDVTRDTYVGRRAVCRERGAACALWHSCTTRKRSPGNTAMHCSLWIEKPSIISLMIFCYLGSRCCVVWCVQWVWAVALHLLCGPGALLCASSGRHTLPVARTPSRVPLTRCNGTTNILRHVRGACVCV